MSRYKTFDATGIAPNGRLYAGDLNAIQDMKADQSNFGQTIDLATARFGDSAIQLLKYGTLEARLTAALRTDGIVRGLGGLFAGTYTTAQRDAIAAGFRPYGLQIVNTTTNRIEWNAGSDAAPSWQAIAPTLGADSITNAMMQDNSVGSPEIVDGAVTWNEINGTLKPSVGAGPTAEALRALGTGANNAAAGNDARLSDLRVSPDNSVTNAQIVAGAGIPYSKLSLGNSLVNADIAAGAAIAYNKLNIAGSVVNADINPGAAIAQSKLATLVINDTHVGAAALSPNRISGTAVITTDSRLSDQRTPIDGTVTSAKIANGQVGTNHLNFDVATQTELDNAYASLNAIKLNNAANVVGYSHMVIKIQTGRVTGYHADAGNVTWSETSDITFPAGAFPGIPRIVFQAGGDDGGNLIATPRLASESSISASGCTVEVVGRTDDEGRSPWSFTWIAIYGAG